MQSIQVQHGSRNVTVYFEIHRGRAVFWSTTVRLSPERDQPLNGAVAGKDISAETLLDRLQASVRSGIEWLESRAPTAPKR